MLSGGAAAVATGVCCFLVIIPLLVVLPSYLTANLDLGARQRRATSSSCSTASPSPSSSASCSTASPSAPCRGPPSTAASGRPRWPPGSCPSSSPSCCSSCCSRAELRRLCALRRRRRVAAPLGPRLRRGGAAPRARPRLLARHVARRADHQARGLIVAGAVVYTLLALPLLVGLPLAAAGVFADAAAVRTVASHGCQEPAGGERRARERTSQTLTTCSSSCSRWQGKQRLSSCGQ